MYVWVAAAAIGIIIALVLVFKYTKTGKNDVLGFSYNAKNVVRRQTDLNVPGVNQIQKTGDKNDVKTGFRDGWNHL